MQARELGAEQAERVDELVLALARHEPAEADDELAVDAEALLERRAPRPARPGTNSSTGSAGRSTSAGTVHLTCSEAARAVYSLTVSSIEALPSTCRRRLLTPGTAPGSVTSAPPRKTT